MRKVLRRRPGHSKHSRSAQSCSGLRSYNLREHHVQRNAQLLRAVDVAVAGRVGDDGIRDEATIRSLGADLGRALLAAHAVAGLDAAPPAALEDLGDVGAALAHVAGLPALLAGHQAGVLDHVGHERGRVAADGEELEPVLLDEALEDRVRADAHAVRVRRLLQDLADGDEGLDVAARPDDVDGDVEARDGRALAQDGLELPVVVLVVLRQVLAQRRVERLEGARLQVLRQAEGLLRQLHVDSAVWENEC